MLRWLTICVGLSIAVGLVLVALDRARDHAGVDEASPESHRDRVHRPEGLEDRPDAMPAAVGVAYRDGQILTDAPISYLSQQSSTSSTDSEGRFRLILGRLKRGAILTYFTPGCYRIEVPFDPDDQDLRLDFQSYSTQHDHTLRVVDSQGEPVAGARLHGRTTDSEGRVEIREDGRVSFPAVADSGTTLDGVRATTENTLITISGVGVTFVATEATPHSGWEIAVKRTGDRPSSPIRVSGDHVTVLHDRDGTYEYRATYWSRGGEFVARGDYELAKERPLKVELRFLVQHDDR